MMWIHVLVEIDNQGNQTILGIYKKDSEVCRGRYLLLAESGRKVKVVDYRLEN